MSGMVYKYKVHSGATAWGCKPEKSNGARLDCTYPGGSVLHWKGQLGNSIWSGNFLSEQNPEGICLLLREKGGQDQCRNIQKLRCVEY